MIILNQHNVKYENLLSVYDDIDILKNHAEEARKEFLLELNDICPDYDWQINEEITDEIWKYYHNRVVFSFDVLSPDVRIHDLNSPKTLMCNNSACIKLEKMVKIKKQKVKFEILISVPYSTDDIETLRACGIMKDVVEESVQKIETVVSCNI